MKISADVKKLHSGIFPNDKNRVFTMARVALQLVNDTVLEAERLGLTDEQFFLEFEDALNAYSIKDHNEPVQ